MNNASNKLVSLVELTSYQLGLSLTLARLYRSAYEDLRVTLLQGGILIPMNGQYKDNLNHTRYLHWQSIDVFKSILSKNNTWSQPLLKETV